MGRRTDGLVFYARKCYYSEDNNSVNDSGGGGGKVMGAATQTMAMTVVNRIYISLC